MYGKMKYGKVLLSLAIAVAMVTTALPAMGVNPVPNTDYDLKWSDTWVPVETPLPDSYTILNETFDADLGVFTAWDLAGDGFYQWVAGAANFDTLAADAEDDGLSVLVDLTSIDPLCVDTVNLEFEYFGTGGVFSCEIDGTPTAGSPYTAGALTDDNIDLGAYVGSIIEINFTTTDGVAARDFNIDNVLVQYTYDVDISIDEIIGMTNGGYIAVFPTYIEFNVTNFGSEAAIGADFHLQIYREEPFDPEIYHCWDLEECFLITWDVLSADGDQATWYYTEQRSYSPTHSYASKPDYLDTYEANSEDYLFLQDWFDIPTEYMGLDVVSAYLTFWVWAEGEFDGTNALDYGDVTVDYFGGGGVSDGPYYDTGGEWEQIELDISAAIGDSIMITFGWYADDYFNYEGMYVDDICIELGFTSDQPLVHQGYKYADIPPLNTTTLQFTLPFDPEQGTYYFQIYTDLIDCDLTNNEINWTIIFDDICDAAITDLTVIGGPEFEMPDTTDIPGEDYVLIPINVTVCNTGTLTKDVPVLISAQHLLEDTIFFDDMESGGDPNWGWMFVAGGTADDLFTIVDTDFYSPTHSYAIEGPITNVGNAKLYQPIGWEDVEGGLKWESELKFNTPPGATDVTGVLPAFRADNYYWDLGVSIDGNYVFDSFALDRNSPYDGASGWIHFDADEYIRTYDLYWEERYWALYPEIFGADGELESFAELMEFFKARYEIGFGIEDFSEIEIGFLLEEPTLGAGEGIWIDDFRLYNEYAGATVWDTEYVVEDLAPGECVEFQVIWNTTEYCDYLITAEITLDCDENESNNYAQDSIRIYEQIYTDLDEWECDDNTYGGDDDWHIVEECSECPDNHFWWNGQEDLGTYGSLRDDLLIIDEVFNFTGLLWATFTFDTEYLLEGGFDYGYLEISNDSGENWYIIDTYNGAEWPWATYSYTLTPGVTWLTSNYTGLFFIMPLSFFTEDMHIRFRMFSDSNTEEKGWFIDNVNLTGWDGVADVYMFEDDMESGDGKWIHMYNYYGCHWHNETGVTIWPTVDGGIYNGGALPYLGTGTIASYGRGLTDFWGGDWVGTGGFGFLWFGDGDAGFYDLGVPGTVGTFSTVFDGSGWLAPASIDLTYWMLNFAFIGPTFVASTLDVWNGAGLTLSTPLPLTPPFLNLTQPIDISAFAGSPTVYVSINLTSGAGGFDWCGLTSFYLNASGYTLPYEQYYNNVDEKAVFCFDLIHAYEAILQFEHNYSFDDGDVGWLEVLDGGTWKPVLYITGTSLWSFVEYDITDYINHEGDTCIRFRFISDSSGVDMGWLVDNVSIEGKLDYKNPTISCALNPAAPNGNCGWYKTAVTFTATAEDNVGIGEIQYRIDGGSWKTYTGPITISVDGEHTVEAIAYDIVGNPSEMCVETFMIDATAPTVSITGPQNGYIYLFGRELFANPLGGTIIIGGIDFSATASDAMSGIDYVSFAVDGMNYEKATSPYTIYWEKFDLLPTSYTLTVSAYDIAGNKGSDATLSFTHWL